LGYAGVGCWPIWDIPFVVRYPNWCVIAFRRTEEACGTRRREPGKCCCQPAAASSSGPCTDCEPVTKNIWGHDCNSHNRGCRCAHRCCCLVLFCSFQTGFGLCASGHRSCCVLGSGPKALRGLPQGDFTPCVVGVFAGDRMDTFGRSGRDSAGNCLSYEDSQRLQLSSETV
jgi:hypothetical protein